MTFHDPRLLDLTAFDVPGERRSTTSGGDLHLLRLALDLQLDAMLLTLGASAHADARAGDEPGFVPWRRWLVEDLELARTLTAAILDGESGPAPGLGGGGGVAALDVRTSLENLVARYTSMESLLVDVLARPQAGQSLRAAASEALGRCRARLGELHDHRREAISASAGRTSFIPGELLG